MAINPITYRSIPCDQWGILLSNGDSSRVKDLLHGQDSFTAIVRDFCDVATLKVVSVVNDPFKECVGYSRLIVTIRSLPEIVTRFHSSRSGYRAQYYESAELGELANKHATQSLFDFLLRYYPEEFGKYSPGWIAATFKNLASKIWIHQGRWLRQNRHLDRRIRVPRWIGTNMPLDSRQRKLVRWGMLCPLEEDRIVLKSGFVDQFGIGIPELRKPDRSKELNLYGFT